MVYEFRNFCTSIKFLNIALELSQQRWLEKNKRIGTICCITFHWATIYMYCLISEPTYILLRLLGMRGIEVCHWSFCLNFGSLFCTCLRNGKIFLSRWKIESAELKFILAWHGQSQFRKPVKCEQSITTPAILSPKLSESLAKHSIIWRHRIHHLSTVFLADSRLANEFESNPHRTCF